MIRVLDSKTVNKIAAGEVVESPKSVVKELMENAIDAGASNITVEIKEGGISYIRIHDNGSGIPKEQVKSAFIRHATSKMSQIEDLEHIFTLGFRGEALASIAAVAQVEMTTKTRDEEIGTVIEIHAGQVRRLEDVATTEGTTITIRNLFYNVPARKKFLKKATTESSNVSELIHKLALGHPEVSFCYINNDVTMLHTAGNNDLKTAVFYVYGKEAANQLLPLSFQKGEYAIEGFIGKPELSRGNRGYENLFINGRFIKNPVVASAVEDAYKTRLMIGKFPVFVLNFTLTPAQIDVNVHPAKLEVRFKDDDEIYDLFYTAVSNALDAHVLIPRVEWAKKPKAKDTVEVEQQELQELHEMQVGTAPTVNASPMDVYTPLKEERPVPTEELSVAKGELPMTKGEFPALNKEVTFTPVAGGRSVDELLKKKNAQASSMMMQERSAYVVDTVETPAVETPNVPDVPFEIKDTTLPIAEAPIAPKAVAPGKETQEALLRKKDEPFFKNYKIVGQLFRTYVIVEQGASMYIIDQHAAHERILFEEYMNRFKEETVVSQRLLSPLLLNLNPMERETLRENKDLLQGFGFGIETFPGDSYALLSVPQLLREPDGVGFFIEILDELADSRVKSAYDMKLMAVATMACKAAVKGHDRMSFQEAEAMINRLLKLDNPFNCPHGRPTIIELTKYELEKMFKRIQN